MTVMVGEDFADLLLDSHLRVVGRPLTDGATDDWTMAAWLYHAAPFCLLAHDGAADPRFIYANITAQTCFGYGRSELVGMPWRLSATPSDGPDRRRLLDAVARNGNMENVSGERVTKSGRRFRIAGAVVWELIDGAGARYGQAATFSPPRGHGEDRA